VLRSQHAYRRHVRDRGPQLIVPAADDIDVARIMAEADTRHVTGSFFFDRPTCVSSMSARSKKSVSVAPRIRQVTVTPVSFISARSANENESTNAWCRYR
jgi:hypothetical protein